MLFPSYTSLLSSLTVLHLRPAGIWSTSSTLGLVRVTVSFESQHQASSTEACTASLWDMELP